MGTQNPKPENRWSVDVLVPSYRRPEALKRAVASIEAVREREGGSLDLRVQVVGEEDGSGKGPAFARNRAAEQGSAEFIALLDDDDEWLPQRLLRAIEVLNQRKKVVLVCGDAELSSGGRFFPLPPHPDGEDRDHGALAMDCFVCASTVTLRRTDWERSGGMDESLLRAEDYELWLRLTRDGSRVRVLPEPLVRRDDGSPGRLSSDGPALAGATLTALSRSAHMPPGSRPWQDRLGRVRAVYALGLAHDGHVKAARSQALQALREAPKSRVAWTSCLQALLSRSS